MEKNNEKGDVIMFEITFRNNKTGEEIVLDRNDDFANYYFNHKDWDVII